MKNLTHLKHLHGKINSHFQWHADHHQNLWLWITNFTKRNSKITLLHKKLRGLNTKKIHCVRSVRIRSYSGLHLPAFGLNTDIYHVFLRIQSECGKTRTRITPNTDTFYAVIAVKSVLIGQLYSWKMHWMINFVKTSYCRKKEKRSIH